MAENADEVTFRLRADLNLLELNYSSTLHGTGVAAPRNDDAIAMVGDIFGLYGGRLVLGWLEHNVTPPADLAYCRLVEKDSKLYKMVRVAVGNAQLCVDDDDPIWICARDTRKILDAGDDDDDDEAEAGTNLKGFTPMSYMNTEDENNCMNFLGAEVLIDASRREHGELTTSYGEEEHKSLHLNWPKQVEHCTKMASESIRLAYMEIWEGTDFLDDMYRTHFEACAQVTFARGHYENWMAHVGLHVNVDSGLADVEPRAGVLCLKLIHMLADSSLVWKQKVVNGSANAMYVPTWFREHEGTVSMDFEAQLDEVLEPQDAISRTHLAKMLRFDLVSPILWGAVRYTQM
jgi:hypothetical protein